MKWGIIGTGVIAEKFANTIMAMRAEGDEVVAVASRTDESAAAFAARHSISHAYGPYERMMDDAAVEAVYIATPNVLHYENAKMALLGGKHVLCEKPFTLNAAQARELYALAREKKLFIMEAFWIRFLPALLALRQVIAAGEIGEVTHMRSDYGFIPAASHSVRKRDAQLGAGALMDIGIYNLGFANMVMDAPPTGFHSTVQLNEHGTDSFSAVLLTYPGGRSASIATAIGMVLPREAVIYGTKGSIALADFQMAEHFTVRPYDGLAREVSMPFEINGFEYEIREVNCCVKLGLSTSDVLREQDTLTVLSTMDAIRASWGVKFPGEA